MAGGLLQLVATGSKDAPLIHNPTITFFKVVYKKHTNFAIQQYVKNLGMQNFGTYNNYKIDRTGDLLTGIYFKINISNFDIIKSNNNNDTTNIFNINSLEIIYNKFTTWIYYINNNLYIIPNYIFKLYNINILQTTISNENIINNLLPEILYSNSISQCILYDIKENIINSILALLPKYINFFENYILHIIINTKDYEFNNQLITTYYYINNISQIINNNLYLNYNYYNNIIYNKQYYNFNEIQQYNKYININDINFINIQNYDVDIIYNYCINNNIYSYKIYQYNGILFNSIFIYTILLQLYPLQYNTFTFWKKYTLLKNNVPNLNYIINTFNLFSEWETILSNSFNSQLLTNQLQLMEIYKKNYAIAEDTINQLFNLMTISNPTQLFIILSTFIKQYDNTLYYINFDDYNSSSNTNLLNKNININTNNYTILQTTNNTNGMTIDKYLTIYPVDLMILYPYLAYNLVDNIYNSFLFTNNMFLIYWRNKINIYFYLNYQQNKTINSNNIGLNDANALYRNLTFYANFNLKNLLSLKDIKKYFLELFYSSSYLCCINLNNIDFSLLLSTNNVIDITQLNVNNSIISLNETSIKSYNTLTIKNYYNISSFIKNDYTIIINKWDNNSKINTQYYITYNNINYPVKNFTNINFILTLTFDFLPLTINTFILNEIHTIQIPLITFNNAQIPTNNIYIVNIFNKINNIIVNDLIISSCNIFNINNIYCKCNNIIESYYFYFKLINININNKIYRYIIDIQNYNENYLIIANTDRELNKKDIINIDLEFINIIYQDIASIDALSIIDNKIQITNTNWTYDTLKTYWLVYNNKYIILRYENGYFIINDILEPVIYIVREINNNSIPSFDNYINYYKYNNSISDLMDFVFQTPMIFLSKTSVDISNQYIVPYVYLYNIPFIININSQLYLNNNLITLILPLNSNQFFNKQVSPLYDKENLLHSISHYELITLMSSNFDQIFNNSIYSNIINTLEKAQNIIVNLNIDMITNTSYYGITSNTIISNILNINELNILNYNNEDFNYYNKLFIDIYGNNTSLLSNIDQILLNIYNFPATSYLPNRKISSNLIDYLNNIPIYFQNNITYIKNNIDYQTVTNPTEYLESYTSLNNIINNITGNIYDYDNYYQIDLLYPLDNISNIYSIYYNDILIDISNIISTNSIITNTFNKLINNDTQFTTEIITNINNIFDDYKFNYIGPVYINNNTINFINIIDISNYLYIQLDDNKIYNIDYCCNINNLNNIIYYNSKLCNFIDTSYNTIFYYINYSNTQYSNIIFYYKIRLDISNNVIQLMNGNYLYNNNNYYYYNIINNNIIDIISLSQFNIEILDYFIGNTLIHTIEDLININININTELINYIHIDKLIILEIYQFNYYNYDNIIINNFFINNIYNPQIITFNIFNNILNFIYIDASLNIINITSKYIYYLDIPPFIFDNNNLVSINNNQNIFINKITEDKYIKLDHYILKYADINIYNFSGNFILSILPISDLNLINYNISGILYITNNTIVIKFNNILSIPMNSYYIINNTIIYLENITNEIILYDKYINYYNPGVFLSISLIDTNYFSNIYPYIVNYEELYLQEDIIGKISGNIIPINNILINKYVINSLLNNSYNDIIYYDISYIQISGTYEHQIELNLYNKLTNKTLIRPIIIKYAESINTNPIVNFIWINNNKIYNNSFIILENIPNANIGFVTLNINYSDIITSIISLQPSININSNNSYTSNRIIFTDITDLQYNIAYKWKLLINNIYPIYFWTYFSMDNFIYSTDSIYEPIYINKNNLLLFSLLDDIQLIGALPNIIINTNNILYLNNTIYYNSINRRLINKYYINSITTTTINYEILQLNYNPINKFIPYLYFLNKVQIINFTYSFIYLDQESINILLKSTYLIIQNNNYYYTTILNYTDKGIFIDTTNFILDNNYKLNIYYSYNNLIFTFNNIILINDINNNYKIVKYKYNNFSNNELILINNILFQIIGLNYYTKYYDLILIYGNIQVDILNTNGYYSLGIPNTKPQINLPNLIYNEVLEYSLDTVYLQCGDYYMHNNILSYYTSEQNYYDIFFYNKKGENITIFCKNNRYYKLNDYDKLYQNDILIYNSNIYIIKCIHNQEIYFISELLLSDGCYNFYYPFQPFNLSNIVIDICGNIICKNNVINKWDFIEINNIFYLSSNIPTEYYNTILYTRVATTQNIKLFFDNKILLNNYTTSITLDNTAVIYLQGKIINNFTVNLNNNNITNLHLYYNQAIRIGSTINFIQTVNYCDTTIIITVRNKINLLCENVEIYLSPLGLHKNVYYSIYEIDNFKPILEDISNSIIEYNLDNNNIINIITNQTTLNKNENLQLFWNNNYSQIDINYNTISPNIYIGSYHLLLEINNKNDYFIHLIKIIYPNNLYLFTDIISINSDFYLDKIYKIQINFIDNSFIYDNTCYYKKQLLMNTIDLVTIWYKYDIIVNNIPYYDNGKFYLEIVNGSIYINQDIYLEPNTILYYNIILLNNLYYLISDIYLGNNINYIYLKNINYIKSSIPINRTIKKSLQNHNDTRLLNYITNTINIEKIVNKVNIILDSVGNTYKYSLLSGNDTNYYLYNNSYYICDPYLQIIQSYIYNEITYIFTNYKIPIIINNETQLFTELNITTNKFNKVSLFKTVPEILSKINLLNKIETFYILNSIKPWDNWTILSAINIKNIRNLLNKGNIIYLNNSIYQDTSSNIYFTNNELLYLSNLLLFLNTNTNELLKINIQTNLLYNILDQLIYWINDYTFWLNVKDRINSYLSELNIDAIFNGSCLVFSDELENQDIYFDISNGIITRKYYLNNQYILINNNIITRNIDNISIEINYLLNNQINTTSYGIEVNKLLNTLYLYGNYYTIINSTIFNTVSKNYKYFNSIKLFINNIWNNYKTTLSQLNILFNDILAIQYNINTNNNNLISYFSYDYTYNISTIIDSSNEYYINHYLLYESYNYIIQPITYILNSNPIYPYKIILSSDIIIPEIIYQLNFYNIIYESYLFKVDKYPIELDFYLENDIDINTKYSIIGTTIYDISSIFLGTLYTIAILNINFSLVDYINYKNNNLYIYKYDISSVYVASLINIDINNILEIARTVGIKNQINNKLIFYQNNFNYINNSTYIIYNNKYIPLYYSINEYYIDISNILPQTITIIILYNISQIINTKTYIYKLNLNSPFINYINTYLNVIPFNFTLNNIYRPLDLIFINTTKLIIQTKDQLNFTTLTQYINVGETPPIEVLTITSTNKYLYSTYETYNLLENSTIWISDTSNYLLGNIGSLNNLTNNNPIQFILDILYTNTELNNKTMYIENIWKIENYIINPLNSNIICEYPLLFILNNSSKYLYFINTYLINNNNIYIDNNKLIIICENNITISGVLTFIQIYISPSKIYKPSLNQITAVNLINNIQINNNIYFIPYDQYGNPIGLYLYKIILSEPIDEINILNINLIFNKIYEVKLLVCNSSYEIIVGSNEIIPNTTNYKLEFNNISINVTSIIFYQNAYQNANFFYQDYINIFYIFISENTNNFNFINKINKSKYYMSSIITVINLNNIFNPRQFNRSNNMLIQTYNTTRNTIITEIPKFNVLNIFQSISLFLDDQLLETINIDTYNILYNLYFDTNKKKQFDKVIEIKKNINGWEIYFPLLFWFYYESNLALPLIALSYSNLILKYKINNLTTILLNNLINYKLSTIPTLNIEICLDTILLDTIEQKLFGTYRHEYIIERFIIYPDNLIYQQSQTVNLRFSNLIKDIYWITKPIYHPLTTAYKNISYEYDTKYEYYLTLLKYYNIYIQNNIIDETNIIYLNDFQIINNNIQEILLNNSDRLKLIKYDMLLNKYNIQYILYILDKYLTNINIHIQIYKLKQYFIHIYKNNIIITEYNPILTLNIQSNGIDFIPKLDNNYYNSVIPYEKFNNSIPIGYYMSSYSLYGTEKQPSGHLNYNKFDNVVLLLNNNKNILNEPFNLKTIIKEYQILRIMSGMGSLAFLN